ncbi:uncharacterized protein [Littorina saxatilis]|uniref:Galectin n=1 Tax=Littorina saxatilis TaxID=31220 RepID=A0AAN9BN27_9CAEN
MPQEVPVPYLRNLDKLVQTDSAKFTIRGHVHHLGYDDQTFTIEWRDEEDSLKSWNAPIGFTARVKCNGFATIWIQCKEIGNPMTLMLINKFEGIRKGKDFEVVFDVSAQTIQVLVNGQPLGDFRRIAQSPTTQYLGVTGDGLALFRPDVKVCQDADVAKRFVN